MKSHFFIPSGSFTQSQAQGFGIANENTFRITSSFSVTAATKAFSICKGVVLVQPQAGSESSKVNLILRPFVQPFSGLNVKYFIYRGLQKSDFFTPQNIVKTLASNDSDFVKKLWTDYNDFYDGEDQPSFAANLIGYEPSVPGNIHLSDLFFKKSILTESEENDAYELPMIDIGKSLGSFASGECGIDVVLNYGDYKHDFNNSEFILDLDYARSAKAQITLSGTQLERKLQKEQIFQFIDIAAFYGLFTKEGTVIADNGSGTKSNKSGTTIYNDLLTPFYTKNRWYLYLQSDRTRSYNYYENYEISENGTNIKIGNTETNLEDETYQTDGWPIWIDESSQQASDGKNKLFLQLVTDNNVNTVLYAQTGSLENAQQNNFSNIENLQQPADEDGNLLPWTEVIKLSTPSISEGSQNKNIANLSLLIYQGVVYSYIAGQVEDENQEMQDVYAKPNFFDDVFDLIKAQPLLKTDENTVFSKMTSEKLKLINGYYNGRQNGTSAVQTVTITDQIQTDDPDNPVLSRVTYITETVDVINMPTSLVGSVASDTKSTPSAGGTVVSSPTYTLSEPFYYERSLFTDAILTVTGLLLKTTDNSIPNKIILGMTKDENDILKDLITEGLKNPRLFLIDLFTDGNEFTSPENVTYQKYKAGIVAENEEGKLVLLMPETDLFVYSIDRFYHFTKVYSDNIPEINIIGDLILDLTL